MVTSRAKRVPFRKLPRVMIGLLAVAAGVGSTAAATGATASSAAAPVAPRTSPSSGAATGPVFSESQREYTTMVATRYQHHNQESEVDHTYFYDCVGFVSYAMSRAAPTAWTTTRSALKIRNGYVPSPARYVALFAKIDAGTNQAGWTPIASVADLQPGDVVAWYYDAAAATKPGSASGHSVIIAGPLTKTGPDAYSALVYDSTGTPHGPHDTRLTNPANKPDTGGKPSGLGQGTIGLLVTPSGAISSVQWSAGGSSVKSAHYGMARPIS